MSMLKKNIIAFITLVFLSLNFACFADDNYRQFKLSTSRPISLNKISGSSEIILDGKLNEPQWESASICPWYYQNNTKISNSKAQVRLLLDERGFWFGFECPQNNPVVLEHKKRGSFIWEDDSVGVVIDPKYGGKDFFEFFVNAENDRASSKSGDDQWTRKWESAVFVNEGGWSCEIFIPFKTLGFTPNHGEPFGLNYWRHQPFKKVKTSFAKTYPIGITEPLLLKPANLAAENKGFIKINSISAAARSLQSTVSLDLDCSQIAQDKIDLIITDQYLGGFTSVSLSNITSSNKRLSTIKSLLNLQKPGIHRVIIKAYSDTQIIDSVQAIFYVSSLYHNNYGYSVLENQKIKLWWCEGTYKVGKDITAPSGRRKDILVEAAKNEYEPVQIIVTPQQLLEKVEVSMGKMPDGVSAEIRRCYYVKVDIPTDGFGSQDWYPDALLKVEPSMRLDQGRNHTFWITFHVTDKAQAGLKQVQFILKFNRKEIYKIPIKLKIFDFILPKETHIQTAYGVLVDEKWHGKLSPQQFDQVNRLYTEILAKHRIATRDPCSKDSIAINIDEKTDDVKIDFTVFDRDMAYVNDKLHLSAFRLPLGNPLPDKLGKYSYGTDGYKTLYKKVYGQIVDYVEAKGLLDKAYIYFIDEPQRSKFAETKEKLFFLQQTIPKLKNLVTIYNTPGPVPYFYDAIKSWVILQNRFLLQRATQRKEDGDHIWWYVCCAPVSPYPNFFIDSPAINHRIRWWMADKYNIEGDLYWAVTYYGRGKSRKDPWKDPMSYIPDEQAARFGNGDGYFLYPPTLTPPSGPLVKEPNPSIRLAMMREGIEDFEYLWLLRKLLPENNKISVSIVNSIVNSPRDFSDNPKQLYELRSKLAEIIEQLSTERVENGVVNELD